MTNSHYGCLDDVFYMGQNNTVFVVEDGFVLRHMHHSVEILSLFI